jgi:hypothetical protein
LAMMSKLFHLLSINIYENKHWDTKN